MAVDTRDKRFSIMGLLQPQPSIFPNPDGTIGTQDRAQFIFLYSGIALDAPVAVEENRNRGMMQMHRKRIRRGRR